MARAPARTSSSRDTWLVALPILLSAAALFLPTARAEGLAAFLRSWPLRPLLVLQANAAENRETRARFDAVVAERDSASLAAQLLVSMKAENADLRGLLGLSRRLGREFRAAEVLHQQVPTDGRTLLLGVGQDAGVREFDPVLAAGGLIGTIRSVSPGSSIALTWAHPDWRASAVTLDGTAYGLVAATSGSVGSTTGLEFRAISYRDTIPLGTMVVTSGLGGAYPKGIPIGTIAGTSREQVGWERVYVLKPAANPSAVAHVLVVLGGGGTGPIDDAFPPPVVAATPRPADSARTVTASADSSARRDSLRNVTDSTRPRRRLPRPDSAPAAPPAAAEPLPTLPDSL